MNDPVAIIVGTVYSAVSRCRPSPYSVLRTWHTLFHLIGGLERWSNLPQVTSKWAAKPKPTSLTHPSVVDGDCPCRISHSQKTELSPDNRFHHSWNCRPGKKEGCLSAEASALPEGGYLGGPPASLCDPRVTSICLTSDSKLLAQPVCSPDSRTSPGTSQIFILRLGGIRVVQSCWGHLNLSVFTHCTRWHIWERSSVGVGGVKQTVRRWVWEASRQTERILTIHTLHRGLV